MEHGKDHWLIDFTFFNYFFIIIIILLFIFNQMKLYELVQVCNITKLCFADLCMATWFLIQMRKFHKPSWQGQWWTELAFCWLISLSEDSPHWSNHLKRHNSYHNLVSRLKQVEIDNVEVQTSHGYRKTHWTWMCHVTVLQALWKHMGRISSNTAAYTAACKQPWK